MAMAKPVIGTDSGGTPEIVVDGETGSLFHYGDFEGLARAIAHLLETPYLISHMGKAGRARIEHQFTIEQYVEKTQQEYLSLIEGTPC
jgi:glycosyltransferase involved in cell wall biosynthesis